MKKLWRTTAIGRKEIKVYFSDELVKEGLDGKWLPEEHEIHISTDCPREDVLETLLHEVIHAINLYTYGYSELPPVEDERLATTGATFLSQVLEPFFVVPEEVLNEAKGKVWCEKGPRHFVFA